MPSSIQDYMIKQKYKHEVMGEETSSHTSACHVESMIFSLT